MHRNNIVRIRQRANELWELAGCPEGQQDEYRVQAEAEIAASVAYGLEPKARDTQPPKPQRKPETPSSALEDLPDPSRNITSKTQA